MNQYDVKIKRKEGSKATIINEMTILSIKGTTNEIDMLIDFQLHLPSVFYTWAEPRSSQVLAGANCSR